MNQLIAKAKVILTALPTWLGAIALAAPVVANQISSVFPNGAQHLISVVLTIGTVATAAIGVIRKVTPVPPAKVGLLTAPSKAKARGDKGAIDIVTAVVLIVLIVLVRIGGRIFGLI